jgi:probable F420-dependent oxidoreductase
MQYGFNLPNSGPLCEPSVMAGLAREGEGLGYDYLTINDHVVLPDMAAPGYPYSETGEFFGEHAEFRHEQLTLMGWIAAQTRRIRLVTAVMVVPHRPAVLAAKMLATLDVLSGGRLVVGVGAGWLEREFEALATPPFAERGAETDEFLRAFKALWTEDSPRFEGKYTRFANIVLAPKPVQKPHPPIWVGGESPPALRRAARFGDTWYPIGTSRQYPMDSLPRLRVGIARLRQFAEQGRREPGSVGVSYRVKQIGAPVPEHASDGHRRLFSGADDDIAADLHALAEAGVTGVDFDIERPDPEASRDELHRVKERIIRN